MTTIVVSDHTRITPSTNQYMWKWIQMHISLLVFPYLGNLLITITTKPHSSQIELSFQSNACKMNGGYPHLRLFVSQQYNQHSQSQHSLFGAHSFPFSARVVLEGLSHHSYLNTLTSHPEHTILVDAIISQSKGLSITSEQSKHHFSEVWKVYSSFLDVLFAWNRDWVHLMKTLRSHLDSFQSSQIYSIILSFWLSLSILSSWQS